MAETAGEGLDGFRAEVRAWLAENCPAEMRGPMHEEDQQYGGRNPVFRNEAQKLWLERMVARGWTAPEWPRDYGGGGLSPEPTPIELDGPSRGERGPTGRCRR